MQIEKEETQFNRLFILKSLINFQKFYKIVLSSREFCKKKYYSYKDWNDTNVKGKISNTRCKLIATVSDQIDFDQSFRRGVESKAM